MKDFIIFYEHKSRELENAVLLSLYLENKGYTVDILHVDSWKMLYKRTKAVITPYAYSDLDVFSFTFFPFCKVKKCINMQYEQLFTQEDEESGAFYPKGSAKCCDIICWGAESSKALSLHGVPRRRIHEVGQVAMDFNCKSFSSYLLSRNYISKKYGIPYQMKWNLFISSFSYSNLYEAQKKNIQSMVGCIDEMIKLSVDSQMRVLEWFKKYLSNHKNDCIIYRPHPSEQLIKPIVELTNKYSNFYVIDDYSIRQWIGVCDSISTWYSTSVADVYFAGKKCAILRPIPIPVKKELCIMREAELITDYGRFSEYMEDECKQSFPISEDVMRRYYSNSISGGCGRKLADECISILKDKRNHVNYVKKSKMKWKNKILRVIWIGLMCVGEKIDLSHILPEKYKAQAHYVFKESRGAKGDILSYRKRIERLVKSELCDS